MFSNITPMRAAITTIAYFFNVLVPILLTAYATVEVHPMLVIPGLVWVLCGTRIAMYVNVAFDPNDPLYAKALAEKVMGIKEAPETTVSPTIPSMPSFEELMEDEIVDHFATIAYLKSYGHIVSHEGRELDEVMDTRYAPIDLGIMPRGVMLRTLTYRAYMPVDSYLKNVHLLVVVFTHARRNPSASPVVSPFASVVGVQDMDYLKFKRNYVNETYFI